MFFLFVIAVAFSVVAGNGEFSILHHPRSVDFKGSDVLKESVISQIYKAVLGFSSTQFSNWKGISIHDPFHLVEGIATISIEGIPLIDFVKGHNIPLKVDTDDESIFEDIKNNIQLRYPENGPHIVYADLSNEVKDLTEMDLFKELKEERKQGKNKHLFLKNVLENRDFLRNVDLLNSVADKISEKVHPDGVPDLYWFKISSLRPLIALYGDNSTEIKEAKQLLIEAILNLNTAFRKAYKDAVFFSVITSDSSHIRRTRSILEASDDRNLNLASDYSEDYPIIFNIILWLCVILGFSLLAVSLVIGNMDPGRDSIIYRMTNPRMKKDN